MVILHITAPARVGGLERVVEALSTGHARRGHAVHVAATAGTREDADAFLGPLAARGVVPHAIVLPGRAYRQERAEIARLCHTLQPSVVHTHGYRADVLASPVARGLGIRTVTTVHGFTGGGWRNRLYEALQVRAFRRFDAVVAVSRPLATLLERRGVGASRLRVLVNAWGSVGSLESRATARQILGIPAGDVTAGWVGRLTPEKGADVLLSAASLLPREVTISFVGDGQERARLEEQAAALGLADRVRWHGIQRNAGALIPAFDIFVLSSHTEGTPMVLFEAMEAGVPVVSTRVGGVPDVISEREAVLVAPNDPRALADAILAVRHDGAASGARVAAATARLRTAFALEPWLEAYEAVYDEGLDRHDRRGASLTSTEHRS